MLFKHNFGKIISVGNCGSELKDFSQLLEWRQCNFLRVLSETKISLFCRSNWNDPQKSPVHFQQIWKYFFGFKHLEYSIFLFGGTEGSKSCSDKSRHRVESYRFYLWIENLKTFSSTTGRFAFFQHNCKI